MRMYDYCRILVVLGVLAVIVVLLAGAGWVLLKKKGIAEQKPPAP